MNAADLSRLTLRASVIPSSTLMDRLTQLVRASEHEHFRSDMFVDFCIVDAFGMNVRLGGKGLTSTVSPIAECEQHCVGFCRREKHNPFSVKQLNVMRSYLQLLVPDSQFIGDDLVNRSPVPAFITIPATSSGAFDIDAHRQAYILMLFLSECNLTDLKIRPPTRIGFKEPITPSASK